MIDPQLERGRKLDRQVSRFGAFQYLINVVRRPNVAPIQIDAVANKASYFDMLMISIERRQLLCCCSLSYDSEPPFENVS